MHIRAKQLDIFIANFSIPGHIVSLYSKIRDTMLHFFANWLDRTISLQVDRLLSLRHNQEK